MHLKIFWLVTLTFYNYCYCSTILPYGLQLQQQQQQQQQSQILGNRNYGVQNLRTNIFGQTYTTSPLQLNTNNKLQQSASQILLNSYGPVPSGKDTLHIVPPTHKPLPPLQPGSVFQQIQKTYISGQQQQQQQQQLLQQQQQQHHQQFLQQQNYPSSLLDLNTNSQSSILIPANNLTLYAANLLATSLLDEPNNNNIPPGFIQIGPNTFRGNNQFNGNNINNINNNNKTDVIIVKTQKKSYIIPMTIVAGQKLDKNKYQELYNQRDKLPVAYTVNQFLFFIKPENVNFLNKLV